ncbi:hypothetical protein [Chelativorans sp. AA-79]|uniref:hypothetical protein n=1 Tax=Chelativorans sp. AA-79 TaxID=3028735 RepID=UPI0023F6E817|nr:hypothetical protein [Chelativorans sp. AA-79]WEX08537.1 hypothetical protein PVE73_21080 [Chelativorans sp. AA-79]
MKHCTSIEGHPLPSDSERIDTRRYRELVAEVERQRSRVREARQRAVESLARAHEAPEPLDTANTIFVALYETHWCDREALFTAMRDLDAACEALHAFVSGFGTSTHPDLLSTCTKQTEPEVQESQNPGMEKPRDTDVQD